MAVLALAAPVTAVSVDSTGHPLLELARELELKRERDRKEDAPGYPGATGLREALHRREQARVPGDEECASSLGASRFSMLHIEVAVARTAEGDFTGAAVEYRRAHTCRPRDPDILAALAGVLFDARDLRGAREAINSSLEIDPRSVSANRLAGNLDYVEERWADATARFRYVAASDEDRVQAGYGQLMYWLAQRRAGVAKPEFVTRTPGDGWPKPLMQYMRGELTESDLIEPIRDGDSDSNQQPNTSTNERLCEALYYVGEDYWARGQPAVARDYFAALVNIKVIYFLEHGLALAEIAKLRK
jgi:lipoprotein NlpI